MLTFILLSIFAPGPPDAVCGFYAVCYDTACEQVATAEYLYIEPITTNLLEGTYRIRGTSLNPGTPGLLSVGTDPCPDKYDTDNVHEYRVATTGIVIFRDGFETGDTSQWSTTQ